MEINWKVRVKNPLFWAQMGAAVLSPILVGLGMEWDQVTTWSALGGALVRAAGNPVIVVSVLISLWTALTDPTTAGLGDSPRALTYQRPQKGE